MPDQPNSQEPVPAPTFNVDMGDVALQLGLHPKRLRQLRSRHLVESFDFVHVSKRCLFSPSAVEKLRVVILGEAVPASPASADGPAVEKPVPAPSDCHPTDPAASAEAHSGIRKAVVVSRLRDFGGPYRQHFPNPAVIEIEFCDEPGRTAFARVRHSRNYAPELRNGDPMVIDVRFNGERWEASGRCPRFPGRW